MDSGRTVSSTKVQARCKWSAAKHGKGQLGLAGPAGQAEQAKQTPDTQKGRNGERQAGERS